MDVLHRAEAALVLGLLRLLAALRPAAASTLGGTVARWLGPLLPVSRVADRNLRLALPGLDAAARRRIVRGCWESLGRTVGELPHLSELQRDTPRGPGWELIGAEHLAAARARGGPAIFVSGHLANWEVLPPAAAACGITVGSFYRGAKNAHVDRILRDLRHRAMGQDVPLFPKGAAGARGALAHLHRGGFVAMLIDQKMNDGIPARLFGQDAMTASAAAALALRLRCPVIPAHVERVAPARLRIVCDAPLPLPDTGNRQADIAQLTQMINDHLEAWIRARPAEWLWLHRRWRKEIY